MSGVSLARGHTTEPTSDAADDEGYSYQGLTFRAVDGQKNIPAAFKSVLLKMGFEEFKRGEPGHSKRTTNLVFAKRSKLADLQSML